MTIYFKTLFQTSDFGDAGGNAIMKDFAILGSSIGLMTFVRGEGVLSSPTNVSVAIALFGKDIFTGDTSRRTGICGDALSNDYFWISQTDTGGDRSGGRLYSATMNDLNSFNGLKDLGSLAWAGSSHNNSYDDMHQLSIYGEHIYLLVRRASSPRNIISLYRRPKFASSSLKSSWEIIIEDKQLVHANSTNSSLISASFIVSKHYYGFDSFDSSSNKKMLIYDKQFNFITDVRINDGTFNTSAAIGNWSADDKGRIYGSCSWSDDSLRVMVLPEPYTEYFVQGSISTIDLEVSGSDDGIIFSEYIAYNRSNPLQKRFLKFRASFSGGEQSGDIETFFFDQSQPETKLNINEFLSESSSQIRFNNLFSKEFSLAESNESGRLFEADLDKKRFKKMTGMRVD